MISYIKYIEMKKKISVPNYFIVFKQTNTTFNQLPIQFESSQNLKNELSSTKLFFDQDLNETLDIIEKLLFFPRINMDVSILTPNQISRINNSAQSIIPIPENYFNLIIERSEISDMDFFILSKGVAKKDSYIEKIENLYTFDEFLNIGIKEFWLKICDYDNGMKDILQYLSESQLPLLPLIHFSDFLGAADHKIVNLNPDSINEISKYRWRQQGFLDTMKLIAERDIESDEEKIEEFKKTAYAKATFPITITAPGQPVIIDKKTSQDGLPNNELKALNLLGIHNAIESNGLHLPIDEINLQSFIELEKLEAHCKNRGNNRYTWRALRKLGALLAEQLSDEQIDAISRASHINAFMNFPLGLAIIPGASAPLSCYTSISYKPITPLTRTLQIQLFSKGNIIVQNGAKILIIECLDNGDRIKKASDQMWKHFISSINSTHFNVVYEVAKDKNEFQRIIKKHPDTLFLIISAHGYENRDINLSGIVIGKDDYWSPIQNDFNSPPIVLFSACHTGARGKGIISIADLFVRCGAYAVLSTLIPVDVFRNGLLMIRFFIYLSESMDGNNAYENISEVWKHVMATNAVNEVIESSKRLKNWAMTKRKDGSWPLRDFQLIESPKRLHSHTVYDDTINILKDIANRDGVLDKLDNTLRVDNCFPESLFYQFVGYPEKIIINPSVSQSS